MAIRKNNQFPGLSMPQLIWIMSLFGSMKSYRATILDPDQYDLITPFLAGNLIEDPNFIIKHDKVHLISIYLNGDDYRKLLTELSPDHLECLNSSLYVWVTSLTNNLHVTMIHKNVYPRKLKKKRATNEINKGNLTVLQEKLKLALINESYEEAAQLRDAIKNIQEKTLNQ